MLVRELIEQLAEMPQEVPVLVRCEQLGDITVLAAHKAGRLSGPAVIVDLDPTEARLAAKGYLAEMIADIE